MWWEQAVIYQVYVRSFQDTNGDGIGDLPGVTARLAHVAELGAAAVWLSPIYPSPNADFGYDVSDFRGVEPAFGTLADLDALVERAHGLALKVLLDFVPCHTSIEHPWFREHPEYYVWADAPPNNWLASFGGTAWERDPASGRYYLHSFFAEQADLDWRNPEVCRVMSDALRFWRARGVDGFRLDALDRLLKDPDLRDDPIATAPPILPLDARYGTLLHTHSSNAPDIGDALRAIREAVGPDTALIGEVYLPSDALTPYLESLDAVFAFEAMHAHNASALRRGIESAIAAGKQGWILSNHDFTRLATRAGPENARAVTTLLMALPGPVFVFQGDELGVVDGPQDGLALDRFGRDAFRHPMAWNGEPGGGFTTGTPWLPVGDGTTASVAVQEMDPHSHLALIRALCALRPRLSGPVTFLDGPDGTIVARRGEHVVAVNLCDVPRPVPPLGDDARPVLESRPGDAANLHTIPAHGGWISHAPV
jgi:alpha-glucosidase